MQNFLSLPDVMANICTDDVTNAINLMVETTSQLQQKLDAVFSTLANSDSYNTLGAQSPIFDIFYQQEASKTILEMINFSTSEFQ